MVKSCIKYYRDGKVVKTYRGNHRTIMNQFLNELFNYRQGVFFYEKAELWKRNKSRNPRKLMMTLNNLGNKK